MPLVLIRHRTTYSYRNPVRFGEHRMLLRPLESYDQRLISAELTIDPVPCRLTHQHDVFGNCVDVARFEGRAERLTFDSHVRVEHSPVPAFADVDGDVHRYTGVTPFAYSPEDLPDLAPSIERQFADPQGELEAWARRFLRRVGPTGLQSLLTDMTRAIRADFQYATRLTGHAQSPLETLALRRGSCRDFAVLMMEAARGLGLAARFVTGYVYSRASSDRVGGGHTHAWVSVYLPACGWVEFDPTNGAVGAADLIRVAIARDQRQALPLHGTWSGLAKDYLGMEVEVDVRVECEDAVQPMAPMRLASGG